VVETTFEPPRCPYCGANLFRVYKNLYETYTFNLKTGTYKGEAVNASPPKCPDCNGKLWDVFPDGVCNYSAKKEIPSSP